MPQSRRSDRRTALASDDSRVCDALSSGAQSPRTRERADRATCLATSDRSDSSAAARWGNSQLLLPGGRVRHDPIRAWDRTSSTASFRSQPRLTDSTPIARGQTARALIAHAPRASACPASRCWASSVEQRERTSRSRAIESRRQEVSVPAIFVRRVLSSRIC